MQRTAISGFWGMEGPSESHEHGQEFVADSVWKAAGARNRDSGEGEAAGS